MWKRQAFHPRFPHCIHHQSLQLGLHRSYQGQIYSEAVGRKKKKAALLKFIPFTDKTKNHNHLKAWICSRIFMFLTNFFTKIIHPILITKLLATTTVSTSVKFQLFVPTGTPVNSRARIENGWMLFIRFQTLKGTFLTFLSWLPPSTKLKCWDLKAGCWSWNCCHTSHCDLTVTRGHQIYMVKSKVII